MIEAKQIPYMLELLNDDNPAIRMHVIQKLTSFGPLLKKELQNGLYSLNTFQHRIIKQILSVQKAHRVLYKWPCWIRLSSEFVRLEKGIIALSEYLNEDDSFMDISKELDLLAIEYKKAFPVDDPLLLARYLFKEKGFQGDEDNYYDPQNCNLAYVLNQKKGGPISLAGLYILVGKRLGLPIEGCNFPGHFLARVYVDGRPVFVDCFHNGDIIERDDIFRVKDDVVEGIDNILSEKVDVETIMLRFLANLIKMYQENGDEQRRILMIRLFKLIEQHVLDRTMADVIPSDITEEQLPIFDAGQIVKHTRYGYRGVIVDFDVQCMASDDWYYTNFTQPRADQPWYHILVDETEEITYVAESSVIMDESPKEIVHPLLDYFFTEFIEGTYIRNDNPWPETEY